MSFRKKLNQAYKVADNNNKQKLEKAFPQLEQRMKNFKCRLKHSSELEIRARNDVQAVGVYLQEMKKRLGTGWFEVEVNKIDY